MDDMTYLWELTKSIEEAAKILEETFLGYMLTEIADQLVRFQEGGPLRELDIPWGAQVLAGISGLPALLAGVQLEQCDSMEDAAAKTITEWRRLGMTA